MPSDISTLSSKYPAQKNCALNPREQEDDLLTLLSFLLLFFAKEARITHSRQEIDPRTTTHRFSDQGHLQQHGVSLF